MEGDDSLLRADLETIYAFSHKSWNPHVVDNEVPADLGRISRDPRFYVLATEVIDSDQENTTAKSETGNLFIMLKNCKTFNSNFQLFDINFLI